MNEEPAIELSASRFVLMGVLILVVLVGGLGGWAVQSTLASAVVVPGSIRPDGDEHAVQHPTGGVLHEVLVRDGDIVQAGQLLARLETDAALSALTLAQAQVFDHSAQLARLEAQIRDAATLTFDDDLLDQAGTSPDRIKVLAGQRALFQAQRATETSQQAAFEQQGSQFNAQIVGFDGQMAAKLRQLTILNVQLDAQKSLLSRGLSPATTVLQLEREVAGIEGDLARLQAQKAAAHYQQEAMRESFHAQSLSRRQDRIAQARDLREKQRRWQKEIEIHRRQIVQSEIRAPLGGIVHQVLLSGPKAVLQPAQPLLSLVPQGGQLIVESQVAPRYRDDMSVGQTATLRISVLNSLQTPEITGRVVQISADTIRTDGSGPSFFRVRIEIDQQELETVLPGSPLLPGMPVEVYLQTGNASPMQYIAKPLVDYLARALRES